MGINLGGTKSKLYMGSSKIKKVYLGTEKVYSAGNIVTYNVDSGVSYSEEVDSDATCLSPTTFTPTKSGYTFVGWKENTSADSSVLSSKIMGDNPITLYAVFKQTITLTTYHGTTTATTNTGTRYYNNANVANPTFTVAASAISGWTFDGWITSSTATVMQTTYSSISSLSLSANTTLYGRYNQTVTVTTYNGFGVASSTDLTKIKLYGVDYNSIYTRSNDTISGWTFNGWCTSSSATAAVVYSSITNLTVSSNMVLYAKHSQTITLSYNGNGNTSGSTASQTGTRYLNSGNYSNPSITVASNGFTRTSYTFNGWAMGSASGTKYNAGSSVTLTASTTFYATWLGIPYTWISNYLAASSTYPLSIITDFEEYANKSGVGTSKIIITDNESVDYGKNPKWQGHSNLISTAGNKMMSFVIENSYGRDLYLNFYNQAGTALWSKSINGAGGLDGGTYVIDVSNSTGIYFSFQVHNYAYSGGSGIWLNNIKFYN